MKSLAFATTLSLLLFAAPDAMADHKGKLPWVMDYEQGLNEARMTGKPIMLFFTADW